MRKILIVMFMAIFSSLLVSTTALCKEEKSMKKPKQNKIKIFDIKTNSVIEVDPVFKTDAEWQKILTPEQFDITVNKGTERAGTCTFHEVKEDGVYTCVRCGTALFYAQTKFESGTGWPSFIKPVSELNIKTVTDSTLGMERTEVVCARCGAHLGHVFPDGPPPTGLRYCINGAALKFIPLKDIKPATKKASFAAGCFWGIEAEFRKVNGVVNTKVGYEGGHVKNPSYEQVCSDKTGHAETVLVEYNPAVISYEKLLDVFWTIHNPTTKNRQGPDIGSQYRSIIFYYDDEQKKAAFASKERWEKSGKFKSTIVTEILPADEFYKAEEYHQQYYEKNSIKR